MENNELEFQKLMFEFYKHLTTVNTATAVIVPTVVAVALGLHFWRPAFALGFFAVSVVFSGWAMLETAKRVKTGVNGGTPTLLFKLALSCVFVGLAIVSWAAIDERPSPSEIAARFTCQILDKTP